MLKSQKRKVGKNLTCDEVHGLKPNLILIIQTAFLGDVILLTAALESIHQAYPKTQIDLVLKKGCERIFEHHPFVNKIYVWDKKNKYPSLFRLLLQLRKMKYDIVFNFHRHLNTGLMTWAARAKYKVGFSENPLSRLYTHKKDFENQTTKHLHETEKNFQLLPSLLNTVYQKPKLYPQNAPCVKKYQKQPYITVHPASAWETKRVPTEIWTGFIDSLPKDLQVYILASEREKPICQAILEKCQVHKTEIITKELTLLQVGALMKGALMNYTCDSAPAHIATAVNAPVCVIFCSTSPSQGFYPLSDTSYIAETPIALTCRPCGKHGHKKCPHTHFYCGKTLSTADLKDKTMRQIVF